MHHDEFRIGEGTVEVLIKERQGAVLNGVDLFHPLDDVVQDHLTRIGRGRVEDLVQAGIDLGHPQTQRLQCMVQRGRAGFLERDDEDLAPVLKHLPPPQLPTGPWSWRV